MRICDWSSDVCSSDRFAEDLGRGLYDGIWVGPDSKIPNTNGYRSDVMAALEKLHIPVIRWPGGCFADQYDRSEEHTSELQSLMRISYAVFCLKQKTIKHKQNN